MAVDPDAVLKAAGPAGRGRRRVRAAQAPQARRHVADRVRRLSVLRATRRYQALVEKALQGRASAGGGSRRRSLVLQTAREQDSTRSRACSAPERQIQRSSTAITLHFHLGAWPLRAPRREIRRIEARAGLGCAMGVLQHLRRLRGTSLDPARNSPERKLAAALLAQYEGTSRIVDHASGASAATASRAGPTRCVATAACGSGTLAVAEERDSLRDQVLQGHATAASLG
jgi:hypothetical protein